MSERRAFQEIDPYAGGPDESEEELIECLEDDLRVLEALKATKATEETRSEA